MSHTPIRCIITDTGTAAFNMAADHYLMRDAGEKQCICLRLYRWKPPAISIGSLQHASRQLNLAKLADEGIDWIRRPTGGRAVLHSDDLTYSIVFPRNFSGTGSSVAATYFIIMKCLVHAFSQLGIHPQIQDSADPLIKSGRHVKLPCFLAPNRDEIMVNGRKLVGSAQYRTRETVLQHGSIPLSEASCTLPRYFLIDTTEQEEQIKLLRAKSISLAELLPGIRLETIISALIEGFSAGFSLPVARTPFSEHEQSVVMKLAQSESFKKQWCSDPEES